MANSVYNSQTINRDKMLPFYRKPKASPPYSLQNVQQSQTVPRFSTSKEAINYKVFPTFFLYSVNAITPQSATHSIR